jgi:hypothetical protein
LAGAPLSGPAAWPESQAFDERHTDADAVRRDAPEATP